LYRPTTHGNPADADGDNVYQVVAQVDDGNFTDTQAIIAVVFNISETPETLAALPFSPPTASIPEFAAAPSTMQPPPEKRVRQLLSETASVQVSLMATRGDIEAAAMALRETVKRQPSMKSAALRSHAGKVLAAVGAHEAQWTGVHGQRSSLTHVSVPIVAGGQPWGALELVFEPYQSASLFGLVSATEILWPVAVFVVSFALFHMYLRRVLQQLDPSAVVPERVRSAYDVIAEGIVMLDHQGRVVLANSAFRAFDAQGGDPLGKRLADHFKIFNDRYGHAVGDKVLAAVSRKLAAGLRDQDLLCRYGGEEFCIVLPECNMEAALQAAERLRVSIERHGGDSVRGSEPLRITSSFGVSELHADMVTIEALIERADKALYQAKAQGRNRVCIDEAWEMQMA